MWIMERDKSLIAALRRNLLPLDADKKAAGVNQRQPMQKQSKNITFIRAALA